LSPGTYVGKITISTLTLPAQDIGVTLNVTTVPALNANPSQALLDDTVTTTTSIQVTSTGSSALVSSASVPSATPWLSVSPASGSTASGFVTLTVTANTNTLPPGTYQSAITLTPQGNATGIVIPVQVKTIFGSGVNGLGLSTDTISMSSIAGGQSVSQNLGVSSTAANAHPFTAAATSTGGWLSVTPLSGAAPALLTVTASPVVTAGSYDGTVTVTSVLTGAQEQTTVHFTVAALVLTANPTSLNFVQADKSTTPAPQTITVTANLPSTFTATTSTSWLKLDVPATTTPGTVKVSVVPSGLKPGTYNGSVDLSGPSNVTVPVTLTVPDLPVLTVTPASIQLPYQLGNTAPQATISVGYTGKGTLGFTAAAATDLGTPWLSVSPTSGSSPATLTVKIDPATLVPGHQTGTITITPADNPTKVITVSVAVDVTGSTIAVQGVLHAASLTPTRVSPGQLVTITGRGLGPATAVTARPSAAGAYDTALADVHVLFDGVAAPLLMVASDQINAIVPYALQGRVSTQLQVQFGTAYSVPIQLKVVDSAPGIFTAGGQGRGQAAALNADSTSNSVLNPAASGSVIVLYGTGEGQTDPPGQDGRIITTDLRRPLLPVTATIDGQPTEVLYAGSAGNVVSGVFQVNVRIPEGTKTGAVAVEIQAGGVASQPGVTIQVR
jgi:uncharacterized protein (TIGR03437 family)